MQIHLSCEGEVSVEKLVKLLTPEQLLGLLTVTAEPVLPKEEPKKEEPKVEAPVAPEEVPAVPAVEPATPAEEVPA